MQQHQLRLRANESLEDLLDRVVDSVWLALSRSGPAAGFTEDDRESLRAGLRTVFSRFIARYDACGLQAICEEAIEPADWNPKPGLELSPRHPWQSDEVKRLVLKVERSLEEFVDALEAEIFREVFLTPKRAPLAKTVRAGLGEAIRRAVGPHLYRSVACGTTELCRDAVASDPWG